MTSFCTNTIVYLLTISAIIHVINSQTIWIDVDSGNIVGVSESGSKHPHSVQNTQRPNYPNNNGQLNNFNHHNRRDHHNNRRYPTYPGYNNANYNQRPEVNGNGNNNNINPEWVCRNSKTGDMMVIASEIMTNRFPEQLQPGYNDQQYQHNPWLNNQNNNDHNNYNQPPQNDPQNPITNDNNNNYNQNNYNNPYPTDEIPTTTLPTIQRTNPPIILTTKKPFPTINDDTNWSKNTDSTTKKSSIPSINQAIDGEGIIMPRGGNFDD